MLSMDDAREMIQCFIRRKRKVLCMHGMTRRGRWIADCCKRCHGRLEEGSDTSFPSCSRTPLTLHKDYDGRGAYVLACILVRYRIKLLRSYHDSVNGNDDHDSIFLCSFPALVMAYTTLEFLSIITHPCAHPSSQAHNPWDRATSPHSFCPARYLPSRQSIPNIRLSEAYLSHSHFLRLRQDGIHPQRHCGLLQETF